MIRLARRNGGNVYITPEQIISILGDEQAVISVTEDSYRVTESPEEVARKVLEYKLAMERYRAATQAFESCEDMSPAVSEAVYSMNQYKRKLEQLAGLEE